MSGGLTCAIVEPSVNSTIEWMIDCGCTTTSIASYGVPNSSCASITSSPLFTRVAELIVTTGPMSQVGWASAWAGVTAPSSALVRPRNGPPLAVRTSLRTSSARPPRRHWASAQCSLSTGTSWPGLASARTSGPPATRDSLFASATVRPARSAASVGASPIEPVIPLSTTASGEGTARRPARRPRRPGQDLRHRELALAVAALGRLGVEREQQVLGGAGLGHRDRLDRELQRLRGEQGDVAAAAGQADDPEPAGVAADHVERLGTDRTGGAEKHHLAGGHGRHSPASDTHGENGW